MRFEWDAAKAVANLAKHGVSFEEASSAFEDPLSLTIGDPLHSVSEARFVLLGRSRAGRLLVVVHADRGSAIRVIGARVADRKERRTYEEDS